MKCKSPFYVSSKEPIYRSPGKGSFFVGCGRCLYCRIQRRRDWTLRLLHEAQNWHGSSFVTLTYSPDNLPPGGTLVKSDLQKFFKRMRKNYSDMKFKYYACGEYGEIGGRPHYHALMFGIDHGEKDISDLLEDVWSLGKVDVGFVSEQSVRYVAQYIDKKFLNMDEEKVKGYYEGRLPEFQLQSQGLGLSYLRENMLDVMKDGFLTLNGVKQRIPRYYLKKLKEEFDGTEEYRIFIDNRNKQAYLNSLDSIRNLTGYDMSMSELSSNGYFTEYYDALHRNGKLYNEYLVAKVEHFREVNRSKKRRF